MGEVNVRVSGRGRVTTVITLPGLVTPFVKGARHLGNLKGWKVTLEGHLGARGLIKVGVVQGGESVGIRHGLGTGLHNMGMGVSWNLAPKLLRRMRLGRQILNMIKIHGRKRGRMGKRGA